MELVGVEISPGPFHWRSDRSTLTGRETEQVRWTIVPDMTGEGGEDVREMLADATHKERGFTVEPLYTYIQLLSSVIPCTVKFAETADTLLAILHV